MLYYNRTEVSEEIDANKKQMNQKSVICHYCYFLDTGSQFQ